MLGISLVGWAFQPNNETDLDAKTPRCEEAESVSEEDTKLLRHYGTKVVSEIKDVKTIRRNISGE